MKIRKAKRKDFKKIAEIYQEGFSEKPYNEMWTLKESINKIKIFYKYCDIWISTENKNITGFLIINSNQWKPGEIIFGEDIGIDKKYRKKEIATKLLEFSFAHYKKKGYKKFMGIINKDAKSFGFIKKLKLKLSKQDLLVEKEL